jgi:hypothetical protein
MADYDLVPEPSYPDWLMIPSKDETPPPQYKPSAPEIEISRSENGFIVDKKGMETTNSSGYLTILAIPYFEDRILFLPVIPGKLVYRDEENPGRFEDLSRKMKTRLKRWATLNPKSIRYKISKSYQNHFLEEHPFQKFVKRMPGNVRGFRIVHPSSITREQILKQLYVGLHQRFENKLGNTVLFGSILPLCIILDFLTLGFVFTALDLTALLVTFNSMLDASHLEGIIKTQKVEFDTNPVLEEFDRNRKNRIQQIPNDADIDLFCQKLNFPKMAKTIKKVRDRQVILNNVNSYTQ